MTQKTGQVEEGVTPCERCGRPSCQVQGGVAVCREHAGTEASERSALPPLVVDREAVKIAALGGSNFSAE